METTKRPGVLKIEAEIRPGLTLTEIAEHVKAVEARLAEFATPHVKLTLPRGSYVV